MISRKFSVTKSKSLRHPNRSFHESFSLFKGLRFDCQLFHVIFSPKKSLKHPNRWFHKMFQSPSLWGTIICTALIFCEKKLHWQTKGSSWMILNDPNAMASVELFSLRWNCLYVLILSASFWRYPGCLNNPNATLVNQWLGNRWFGLILAFEGSEMEV